MPEITTPVDLCDARGRLDPRAVGWTRTPLHRPNLRGWGRTKRWEYWGIVTPRHVLGLTISSLDYAGVAGVYLLDRATGRESVHEDTIPLASGVELAPRAGVGRSRVDRGPLSMTFEEEEGGTRLLVTTEAVVLDAVAERPAGHEGLGVVVPWSPRRFQYTFKDVARPVTGTLSAHGEADDLGAGCWAVLDHGRGRWPYSARWNWAAGSGVVDGEVRGIQLGGQWTVGTGSTENALVTGGRVHKIHEELTWDYDRSGWERPWRVHGERCEVTLTPFHVRRAATHLVVAASRTHQAFGTFSGWAVDDDGVQVGLDGLVGWAEEAVQRW
jgi:hypothetical protein